MGDINEDINLALRETQARKILEITCGGNGKESTKVP